MVSWSGIKSFIRRRSRPKTKPKTTTLGKPYIKPSEKKDVPSGIVVSGGRGTSGSVGGGIRSGVSGGGGTVSIPTVDIKSKLASVEKEKVTTVTKPADSQFEKDVTVSKRTPIQQLKVTAVEKGVPIREPLRKEPRPLAVSAFKPPEWKKAPLRRVSYEISREREREIQRPTRFRIPKQVGLAIGAVGVGGVSVIAHPIEAGKGFVEFGKGMVIGRKAPEIGRALRKEPAFAITYGTALILGPKYIPKGVRAVTKAVSPRYVKPTMTGLEYGKFTERVTLQKQMSLVGKKITIVHTTPKRIFKPFKKVAIMEPAKRAEMGALRLRAGEAYTYWAPPAVKTGRPKALLGFGGITPAEEVGISYAIKHPGKVKWTLFKPSAEAIIVKGRVKGFPKYIRTEKQAAAFIMKRPGEIRLPAEVYRKGIQEYQIAISPPKLRRVGYKWTELYGQKLRLIEAEIIKPPKIGKMKPPKIVRKRILEIDTIKTMEKYYAPEKYYQVKPYYPTKPYYLAKPTYYKKPVYYEKPYYLAKPTYYKKPVYYEKPYPVKPTYYPKPYYPKKPAYYPIEPKVPPEIIITEDILPPKKKKRKGLAKVGARVGARPITSPKMRRIIIRTPSLAAAEMGVVGKVRKGEVTGLVERALPSKLGIKKTVIPSLGPFKVNTKKIKLKGGKK